jgi:deoxycytidylate deaminase
MSDPRRATGNRSTAIQAVAGDLFDPKKGIASTRTSELVIALCGPIGSPLHKVADTIKGSLQTDFGYEICDIIRLSQIIQDHSEESEKVDAGSQYDRVKKLIGLGDRMRARYGSSVLAELAISKVAIERERSRSSNGDERHQPRRVCHILDSIKNQEELEILKSVYGDMLYFFGVFSPLPARVKSLERQGMSTAQIYDLIDQDSGEEFAHGQTVRDTFPEADFFLRIDSDTDTQIKARVERFLHIILGTKLTTPANSETAMYLAASAAGNSACLSRQVGAALTDANGEVIAIGWNDVPKFGGNLYVFDPKGDPNGEKDKRCWNLEGGTCFNDREKRTIAELLVEGLAAEGLLERKDTLRAITHIVTKSKVRDLIEFSRMQRCMRYCLAVRLLESVSKGENYFILLIHATLAHGI